MNGNLREIMTKAVAEIRDAGLYKEERVIASPQGASIHVGGRDVLNFCANNYLGLSSHPAIVEAASAGLHERGFGMSSVRFICGTQDIHKSLEAEVASFLRMEDAILYSSCFDANGGLFETLLTEEDAIISDALNHASIIDGVRLCKAERLRYAHGDMDELERHLAATRGKRLRMIATDGVFSMDGDFAKLGRICDLAATFDAIVMVDDSHATGFVGTSGRGTPELLGVEGRVDIITSTLGKAMGGALGGFTTGAREVVEFLRQRSRPYLFSNSLAPAVVAAARKAIELIAGSNDLRQRLNDNARLFREGMAERGFRLKPGSHPIVPVMIGDARLAAELARVLLGEGIYVIGFSFPVVPKGEARVRVQLSAAHTRADVERALDAFQRAGSQLGII
ncbi:MAG: glycine C-acetyltransferase [bacterium]